MKVAIVSGGMDSVVLAHKLHHEETLGAVMSFNYGQRHNKEIGYAAAAAQRLGAPFYSLSIPNVGDLIAGASSLLHKDSVPDGHYAQESMRRTIVPNRNMIMLSIAAGFAAANNMDAVATAVHGGDHFIYPDCRAEFVDALDAAVRLGTLDEDSGRCVELHAPFVRMTKADIAALGHELNVPFDETWSCYKGGDVHCGACGTCFERREAFALAGVVDPTHYLATPDYVAP